MSGAAALFSLSSGLTKFGCNTTSVGLAIKFVRVIRSRQTSCRPGSRASSLAPSPESQFRPNDVRQKPPSKPTDCSLAEGTLGLRRPRPHSSANASEKIGPASMRTRSALTLSCRVAIDAQRSTSVGASTSYPECLLDRLPEMNSRSSRTANAIASLSDGISCVRACMLQTASKGLVSRPNSPRGRVTARG